MCVVTLIKISTNSRCDNCLSLLHLVCINCDVQDITAAWKKLENAEKGFEEWLLSEMQRYLVTLVFFFSSAFDKLCFWNCLTITSE